MAARPLPDAALLTITIQLGGTLSSANANQKLGPLDSVAFHNTAGFPVDIVMTNTLSSIRNLLQGVSSGAQGGSTPLNVTLNYTILNHNIGQPTGGPYSIPVRIGPFPLPISPDTPSPH